MQLRRDEVPVIECLLQFAGYARGVAGGFQMTVYDYELAVGRAVMVACQFHVLFPKVAVWGVYFAVRLWLRVVAGVFGGAWISALCIIACTCFATFAAQAQNIRRSNNTFINPLKSVRQFL